VITKTVIVTALLKGVLQGRHLVEGAVFYKNIKLKKKEGDSKSIGPIKYR
jgi:hypothetical protein